MSFELTPDVEVRQDEEGRVRRLTHTEQPFTAPSAAAGLEAAGPHALEAFSLKRLADDYLQETAPIFGFEAGFLGNLDARAGLEAMGAEEGELRFKEERVLGGSAVVSYDQTKFGLPVWQSGVAVHIDTQKQEVTGSSNETEYNLAPKMPGNDAPFLPEKVTAEVLAKLLGLETPENLRINEKRLLIYRYHADHRLDPHVEAHETPDPSTGFAGTESVPYPNLPLPPVPPDIVENGGYVVAEMLFNLPVVGRGLLNWRAFIEPVTGAVLYLRPLVACAQGVVFLRDPATASGQQLSAASPAATLDALRNTVTFQNLSAPAGGIQRLEGSHVRLVSVDSPNVALPQAGTPFDFTAPSAGRNFSACGAYHHCDVIYRYIQGLGINLSTYFDGTAFPVPVDPHALDDEVNAEARGNVQGNGMEAFVFGKAADDGTNLIGIAADVRVVWHEFGHALLWDHVNSPNFGFAHSAGDALAAILFDPDSLLRDGTDRFETFPFMRNSAGLSRRHDRKVNAGWAWGGSQDNRQYGSEQILSSTLFRIYQAAGGDSPNLTERRWAARYMSALIIKAIALLTVTTRDPDVYVQALINTDNAHGMFEGHPGGAFRKVLRWSFEQQGLYQPAGTQRPFTSPGAAPPVDVYIEDGRKGAYMPFLTNYRGKAEIWNRTAQDNGTTHQTPVVNVPGFAFVRIRNRGTAAATGITVRGFQSRIASPQQFPTDWLPLATASLPGPASLAPGDSAIVGPFTWTPQFQPGELLFAVSAAGDPANTSSVTAGPILNSRLVPLDNNVGQLIT